MPDKASANQRGELPIMFDDLNGFDPLLGTIGQDVDLSLRVNRSGCRLIFNPQYRFFRIWNQRRYVMCLRIRAY